MASADPSEFAEPSVFITNAATYRGKLARQRRLRRIYRSGTGLTVRDNSDSDIISSYSSSSSDSSSEDSTETTPDRSSWPYDIDSSEESRQPANRLLIVLLMFLPPLL